MWGFTWRHPKYTIPIKTLSKSRLSDPFFWRFLVISELVTFFDGIYYVICGQAGGSTRCSNRHPRGPKKCVNLWWNSQNYQSINHSINRSMTSNDLQWPPMTSNDWLIDWHSDYILTTFWLHSGSILATFWLHSGYILGTFWVHSDYILTTFWLYSDCILTTFWLHSDKILATLRLHSGYTLTAFWLYSDYILTRFRLHSNYIPTTFRIHSDYILTISDYLWLFLTD